MTYKLILLLLKVNHCAKYQHQMSFCLKINQTHRYTHRQPTTGTLHSHKVVGYNIERHRTMALYLNQTFCNIELTLT